MKRRLVLLLAPTLLLVGCAGAADPYAPTDKELYKERSDSIVIRQETTRMSDGSEVVCTIATGPNLNTMDCVVVRYDTP